MREVDSIESGSIDGQTEKQTDRQTDRQTNREDGKSKLTNKERAHTTGLLDTSTPKHVSLRRTINIPLSWRSVNDHLQMTPESHVMVLLLSYSRKLPPPEAQ